MKRKIESELLEELLDITYTLTNVYENLIKYDYQEDNYQYQKWKEYLMLCLEVEDKIYKTIFDQTPKTELERLSRKVSYQNNKRKENPISKELVTNRIVSYLETKDYINPFLSLEVNDCLNEQENGVAIAFQCNLDYICNLINLYNQKISITNSKRIKKAIINSKYKTIFVNKIIETLLLNGILPKLSISGKSRALLFNQDEELVELIYQETCLYLLNLNLNELLSLEEAIGKIEEPIKQVQLINIECCLSFFEKDQLQDIVNQLYNQIEDYQIINDIELIIKKIQSNQITKSKNLTKS